MPMRSAVESPPARPSSLPWPPSSCCWIRCSASIDGADGRRVANARGADGAREVGERLGVRELARVRLEPRGVGPRATLERVASRDRREREDAGRSGRRRSDRVRIEARRHFRQRVEQPSRIRGPAPSAGRHRCGNPSRAVLRRRSPRAWRPRRTRVGVDRFLPVAEPRKGVRRHVQRVRRRRRDFRVTPRRLERAIGQRRKVVAVDDVVREAGMIRLASDQLFENRAGLELVGEGLVGR